MQFGLIKDRFVVLAHAFSSRKCGKLFIKKLKNAWKNYVLEILLDKSIDIGAIVAPSSIKKNQSIVKKGEKEGSKLATFSWSCPKNGFFYPPSIFTNVSPSSFIAQVEIFGPVLSS